MVMLFVLFLMGILGILFLGCYIMTVIKMFQHADPMLGLISLATLLCGGVGFLVAFVAGWLNVGKYQTDQLMLIWTVVLGLLILLGGGGHYGGVFN